MKPLCFAAAQLLAATVVFMASPALAQSNLDPGKAAGAVVEAALADGEVRKIDKETGKITIRHGEIKHLDMPPMTMVFTAKDKSALDGVQVGQKIKFLAVHESSKFMVTDIRPAP